MEQEQRKGNLGNYVLFSIVAVMISASGAVGAGLEQVADNLLAELSRLIDNMGSDPPNQAQAVAA